MVRLGKSVSFISLSMLLITSRDAFAQRAEANSPEVVSRVYLEALISKDWTKAVQQVDPAELARNRAMFKPLFDRDSTNFLMQRLLDEHSSRRFADFSDAEFNARLLAFFIGVSTRGTAIDRLQGVDVFGVARPEEDHAFVVYQWRLPEGERPIRGRNVNELHRRNGKWLLDMAADFTSIKEAFEHP